jgi:hypothetical protein
MKFADIIPLLEQPKDNWLYNWFKNVPEQKIANTFVKTEILPININDILNGKFINTKKTTFNKKQILNILSSNSGIVLVPKDIFVKLADSNSSLAVYIDSSAAAKLKPLLNDLEAKMKKMPSYKNDQSLLKAKEQAELQIIYSGKIIVPENFKEEAGSSRLSGDDVVRHETTHYLYDMTQDSAEGLIKKICSSSKCQGYYNEETEIYSYLFTLRSKFKMQPIDVIKSVNMSKANNVATISIVYNRNGKDYIVKDNLPVGSSTIKAIECCTGSFEKSLKDLHNTLAMSGKSDNTNLA